MSHELTEYQSDRLIAFVTSPLFTRDDFLAEGPQQTLLSRTKTALKLGSGSFSQDPGGSLKTFCSLKPGSGSFSQDPGRSLRIRVVLSGTGWFSQIPGFGFPADPGRSLKLEPSLKTLGDWIRGVLSNWNVL